MRTATTAATLVAAVLAFGAAPAIATDNPAKESRAEIQRILSHQNDLMHAKEGAAKDSRITASVSLDKKAMPLDRYQLAHDRLFGSRFGPKDR